MKSIKNLLILFSLFCLFLVSGCETKTESKEIKIAEQYGLAYAPLQIMKEKNFLNEALPDVTITWKKVANTVATREAMLSDNLDVGFIGIPPFLIGYDQEMPWKIMTGLSQSPLGLVTNDENIKTLSDLVENGKIALPQPGSIQHILLAMAADKELGQSDIFDNQLVAMKHPDGMQALISGNEVKAHFTSPPYLFQELDIKENHLVVSGDDAMSEGFTFIVGVCTEKFNKNQSYYEAVNKAIIKSIEFINTEKEETIDILSKAYKLDKAVVEDYIYNRGMQYNTEIKGIESFIDFMHKEKYLNKKVEVDDVLW
ncbi:ABC transporter substrate-binding protein [Oceanirhabdus sp. W0125-5]|uniref:ABC transporter substrate-binding protein n=1 Tax=Oceanirhabdus sp. W0125-5 TaxID=2999116 RepID=UPI0022F2FF28|nr:ABC transporter substrate-binding protein [Oceanirhabdus sp. W0125-5]WBW98863.1 ABC transporter substrate-binding protein [Oceanirhabdus sp. W0125-5]